MVREPESDGRAGTDAVKGGVAIRVHAAERTTRRLTGTAALPLFAAAAAAPAAPAQSRDGEPTAEHLWEAYPLDDGTPPPVPTRAATPAPAPDRRAAPEDPGTATPGRSRPCSRPAHSRPAASRCCDGGRGHTTGGAAGPPAGHNGAPAAAIAGAVAAHA